MAQIGNRRFLWLRTAGWAWRDAVWRKTLLVAASKVNDFSFPFLSYLCVVYQTR